jgi:hypothetical protein
MTTPAVRDDEGSGTVAVPLGAPTGLEDLDSSDLVVPRLNFDHKNGTIVDSLTKEAYDSLDVVVLGLVKQRILWEPEVRDDAKPLCRSYEHKFGHPDVKNFPWEASGFPEPTGGGEVTLDCESCALKEWGSHPTRDTTWCAEQYVLGVLVLPDEEAENGAPALLTMQRSGLKPVRTYLSGFSRMNTASYIARTRITLDLNKRGSVDYVVPQFRKTTGTPAEMWAEYAEQYRTIRAYLTTPRRAETDDAAAPAAPATAPAAPAAPAPAKAEEEPVEVAEVVEDDTEIPF